ncbi:MAG: glycosyltransferase family 39 protein [Kiritimatiellae bacterium]|nr:glycosyltransferase family 39 protein [Kiritimatiellia bacterium]
MYKGSHGFKRNSEIIAGIMSNLQNKLFSLSLVVIVCAFLIVLFYRGFNDPDEGRYSEIPREMVAGGNWLEMHMLGYRYYEKPPLTYWLVAPAIKVFGARDWAVRVPLLVSGLMLAGIFWLLARRKWERTRADIATLTMLSMIGFLAGTGLLLTDSFLVMWFALTCIALFFGCQPGVSAGARFLLFSVASIAAAMGFLTKGAVAIVLPPAIIFIWLIWERRPATLRTWSVPWVILLCVGLLTPVMLLLEKHNPGFFHFFVIDEHFSRFTGTREVQLHPEPFWFFGMVIPLLIAPWTLFIVRAAWRMIARWGWRTDTLTRFLLVWIVVVVGFFSASTGKLMSYILPAIPALGLLLGRWGLADREDTRRDQILWNIGVAGLFIVAATIMTVWLISFFKIIPEDIYPISGRSVVALFPIAAILIALIATRGYRSFAGLLGLNAGIMLAAALLLSPLAGKDFNVLLHINSSHVYKQLAAELKPDDQVVVFWSYRPALPFYTRNIYVPFQDTNELLYGMQAEPERAWELKDKAQLEAFLQKATGRVFAVIEPQDIEKRFKPLALATAPTTIPCDPDTIILELLRSPRP